jgi:hypothetical protein
MRRSPLFQILNTNHLLHPTEKNASCHTYRSEKIISRSPELPSPFNRKIQWVSYVQKRKKLSIAAPDCILLPPENHPNIYHTYIEKNLSVAVLLAIGIRDIPSHMVFRMLYSPSPSSHASPSTTIIRSDTPARAEGTNIIQVLIMNSLSQKR